jgi:hypothetical protein
MSDADRKLRSASFCVEGLGAVSVLAIAQASPQFGVFGTELGDLGAQLGVFFNEIAHGSRDGLRQVFEQLLDSLLVRWEPSRHGNHLSCLQGTLGSVMIPKATSVPGESVVWPHREVDAARDDATPEDDKQLVVAPEQVPIQRITRRVTRCSHRKLNPQRFVCA